jgi:hypothetical protein
MNPQGVDAMKLFPLIAVLVLGANLSLATPPPQNPGDPMPHFPVFVPSGGGYKGAAKLFPLTVKGDACDRGWLVKLLKTPGILGRYRVLATEIHRGECETDNRELTQTDFLSLNSRDEQGTDRYWTRDSDEFILVDSRYSKDKSQPTWVARIGGRYFQATIVSDTDLP